MAKQVHVIGAGLAGLSAAVALVEAGQAVTVHEAAGYAGGRCRSLFDERLGRQIDNGNHLLLSGNRSVYRYLRTIGAVDGLSGPERAKFPFFDLESGERWTIAPNAGPVPWWILCSARRVPGSRPLEYLRGLQLAWVRKDATVRDSLDGPGVLFRRFWEPLAVAALNTSAEEGAARLLWPVVRETFGRGEAACRPRIAKSGLSDCFVGPALHFLEERGVLVTFHSRLRAADFVDGRVKGLRFSDSRAVDLQANDAVILAVPPAAAAKILPNIKAPTESRAIVNGHFLVPQRRHQPYILGLIGGLCQWLFVRDDIASVTVSAADSLAEDPPPSIAQRMWREVSRALDLGDSSLPDYRIIKEKRATFAQTPAESLLRPGVRTSCSNLFLAGDWTDTGLPATIEGSIRSGGSAANAALKNVITP